MRKSPSTARKTGNKKGRIKRPFLLFTIPGGVPAIGLERAKREHEAQKLGEDRRKPHRVATKAHGECEEHGALQHEPAADGNADGRHGALIGCHKAADDDVEAQQQIRDAVLPESLNGV